MYSLAEQRPVAGYMAPTPTHRHPEKIARLGYSDEGIFPPEIIGEPAPMRRDYPILFWLAPALTEGMKILNLGGNAGAEFFTYRQFVSLPNKVRWLVWDLPHAVSVGKSWPTRWMPPAYRSLFKLMTLM